MAVAQPVAQSGTPRGRTYLIISDHGNGSGHNVKPQRAGYFRLEQRSPTTRRAEPVHFSKPLEASQSIDERTGSLRDVVVLAR